MAQALEWTKEEFILLISKPELPDEELTNLLPNRSQGAVAVVRDPHFLNSSLISKDYGPISTLCLNPPVYSVT